MQYIQPVRSAIELPAEPLAHIGAARELARAEHLWCSRSSERAHSMSCRSQ